MRNQSQRGNIFASVLEEILHAHQSTIGHLDDRTTIHREKVRRLQHSLTKPRHFHTLSPDDLDAVIISYRLNLSEKIRLRAAILATSIEATLTNRISNVQARDIAWQVLPVLEQVLFDELGDDVIRQPQVGGSSEEGSRTRYVLEPVLELLDDAMITLHLSIAATEERRYLQARQAEEAFSVVIEQFDDLDDEFRQDAWQFWRAEAQRGRQKAQSLLDGIE